MRTAMGIPVLIVVITAVILELLGFVEAATHPMDLQGLQIIYTSLNCPSKLTGWKANGGDPCTELWRGVSCQGSSVVSIKISGLGLNGTMGYMLNGLKSLKTLDMSGNFIHGSIPFLLPSNLTSLNLANNNLRGNIPYSIIDMTSINYMNLSRNSLHQSIGDVFTKHSDLATLDLSFNNFTGDLPPSLGSLSKMSILHLQDNQLSGTLDVLVDLPLVDLNVANNGFSGWIPIELITIPNSIYDGNSFANSPGHLLPPTSTPPPPTSTPPPPTSTPPPPTSTPPLPTSTPPPPSRSDIDNQSYSPPDLHKVPGSDGSLPFNPENRNRKKGWTHGAIIGIVLGSVLVVLVAVFALIIFLRRCNKKEIATGISTGNSTANANRVNRKVVEPKENSTSTVVELMPLPMERMSLDIIQGRNGSIKRANSVIPLIPYTVAALQTATNSFCQENLVGEGSTGRVYRADFPNGKILAIKKFDSAMLSLQEDEKFLEIVTKMSMLRHRNIVALVGYCVEHGQHLLAFDYVKNGSLHDMLHYGDERSKKLLTWNARVKVALGVAWALEYLHEVCTPFVVHGNFKSGNILLDEDLNPQLSDCGLSALTPNVVYQVSSTQMAGSFGYSAPEFVLSGIYTVKSDVYSFGVVMLELLTGRKPLDSSRERSEQSLVRWAAPQLHDIDALARMVDPSLNGMYPAKSLSRFADVIALCVQPEPEFRPPMSEIVRALVRLVRRASLVRIRSNDESGVPLRTPEHSSINPPY
ncbi:unnamed protein product [Cuscuta epithymum]|uniref:Protein kinase domain-containing protein n=1 Tax=Cuscuta epithymum TaxID=186058 RepID=A0AAV0CSL3_9ASTE|nr:unnamed protein product [Cuscuta epithymum]